MAISRLGWDFSYSLKLLKKSDNLPVVPAGTPLTMKVFSKPGGATLKTWTSAQGYITSQADGRIVWAIPAAEMAAPLTIGSLAAEVRRTDTATPQVILAGFWRVNSATTS